MHGLSHSTREKVLSAFEAGAGMLRALEAVSASLGEDREQQEAKTHVRRAMGHVRAALDELRGDEEDDESHPGALGFTVAVRRHRRRAGNGSESRRTS